MPGNQRALFVDEHRDGPAPFTDRGGDLCYLLVTCRLLRKGIHPMGRPPIGDVAMTAAERMRKHRFKHAPVTKHDRVRRLEAELAALKALPRGGRVNATMQQRALRAAREEIRAEVTAEIHAEWDGIIERYNGYIAEAKRIFDSHRGIITRADYRTLLASLHPDHNKFEGASDVFRLLKELEPVLVKPDVKQINAPPVPKTVAELLARRKVKR
jgi:hypothetical protein